MNILLVKKTHQDMAIATFILQPTCLVDALRSMPMRKKEKLVTEHGFKSTDKGRTMKLICKHNLMGFEGQIQLKKLLKDWELEPKI